MAVEITLAGSTFKSNALPLRIPKAGEMVRVEGRRGLFVVKHLYRGQRTADLMQRVGKQEVVERKVPLMLIRTMPPQASKAIRQFLGTNVLKRAVGQSESLI